MACRKGLYIVAKVSLLFLGAAKRVFFKIFYVFFQKKTFNASSCLSFQYKGCPVVPTLLRTLVSLSIHLMFCFIPGTLRNPPEDTTLSLSTVTWMILDRSFRLIFKTQSVMTYLQHARKRRLCRRHNE